MELNIKQRSDGVTIQCRVTPRSSRNALKGIREGVLLVALNAPPIEGRANQALIEFLAKIVGIPKSHIELVGGQHGRNKIVFFQGLTPQQVSRPLAQHLK